MDKKVKRSYTITDSADALLAQLAIKNGVSKTAILELLIRKEAREQGVEIKKLDAG